MFSLLFVPSFTDQITNLLQQNNFDGLLDKNRKNIMFLLKKHILFVLQFDKKKILFQY